MGKTHTDVSREAVALGSRGCRGIWGLEGVRVNGNIQTDSFNSDVTLYDPARALENGDVCSGRGIDGMGSFEINGDAMTGLGYGFEISGAAYDITGVTTSNIAGLQVPAADMGTAPYDNDNDDLLSDGRGTRLFRTGGLNLTLDASANLMLPEGTYYFDSITLRGDSRITIRGPTTIYVAGDIVESGTGFVNNTEDPSNLMIVCGGSHVELNGSSPFYGQILAPDADVTLGGTSDFYGEVIGETVWMLGDFQFHVDESSPLLNLLDDPVPPMLVR
jgi:hypothetical protein